MYCVKCGVALGDTEKQCPLCGTPVYHPELTREEVPPLYPQDKMPPKQPHPWGVLMIVTLLFLLPMSICLTADLQVNGQLNWSGYVIGALIVLYAVAVLPFWFKTPNPVIFVPIDFAVVGTYLLYINYAMDGDWFLSLALPVTVYLSLVVTAVITLYRYVRRGRLYICGGATIALGVFIPVLELLVGITFDNLRFMGWSFLPMSVIVLFGGFLIFLGICRPAREVMERKFFI
jgi:hypothetical protein